MIGIANRDCTGIVLDIHLRWWHRIVVVAGKLCALRKIWVLLRVRPISYGLMAINVLRLCLVWMLVLIRMWGMVNFEWGWPRRYRLHLMVRMELGTRLWKRSGVPHILHFLRLSMNTLMNITHLSQFITLQLKRQLSVLTLFLQLPFNCQQSFSNIVKMKKGNSGP